MSLCTIWRKCYAGRIVFEVRRNNYQPTRYPTDDVIIRSKSTANFLFPAGQNVAAVKVSPNTRLHNITSLLCLKGFRRLKTFTLVMFCGLYNKGWIMITDSTHVSTPLSWRILCKGIYRPCCRCRVFVENEENAPETFTCSESNFDWQTRRTATSPQSLTFRLSENHFGYIWVDE